MLRRTSRANVETREIRLGALRLDVSEHEAPDGTLRVLKNLRPAGPESAPYYTPVAPRTDLTKQLGTVCAIGSRVTDAGETLVVVSADQIYSVDPDTLAITSLYSFSSTDTTRKALFAQVGGTLFIAVSSGSGTGAPEILLQLRDVDGQPTCFEYNIPDLPVMGAAQIDTQDADALGAGFYAYRYAYQLADGTYGPLSRPYILDLSSAANQAKVRWVVISYPESLSDGWKSLITGIAIFLSPPADSTAAGDVSYIDTLMNSPFYHVTTIAGTDAGAEVTWSDATDNLVGYPQASDDSLLQHRLSAAACFAYNKRLLLGDVSYHFRAPIGGASLKADDETTEPPVITAEADPAIFKIGSGQTANYYAESLQRAITDFSLDVAPPNDFDYKIYGWDGTKWVLEQTNQDFSDPSSTYLRMRLELIEDDATIGGGNTVMMTAKDSDGLTVSKSFGVGFMP